MIYVALDLETTGLDAGRDAIIEVGAVKFDERRELDAWSSLVNPGRPIPIQITQLTSITDQQVLTAPPFAALRARLLHFVGDAVIVGHNVGFDLDFLHHQNCFNRHAFIDTFALATILMPHESRYGLGGLMDSLGISFPERHRALDDARASMRLFRVLGERAAELPASTLRKINQAARSSAWPLKGVFQQAERDASRQSSGSIAAQLQAKGRLSGDRPMFARIEPTEPLTPVDQRTLLDIDTLAAMLEKGGAFEKAFPGFEHRPQQVEMLRHVGRALNQSRHLLVEAGTGTGKSVAYLLPTIHWAAQNGERVVVSTNTINLQDQLYHKDIPDLRALLPFEVRAAVLKGRSNYVCLRRLEALQNRRDLSDDELSVLSKVMVWLPHTITGDRTELFLPSAQEGAIWAQLASDADMCAGERCAFFRQGQCFFHRARRQAENAHLIIVNHALLLSDVAAESRVLPPYNYLIVDEAHHLEDATTNQLGYTLTAQEIVARLSQIGRADQAPFSLTESLLTHCRNRIAAEAFDEMQDRAGVIQEINERIVQDVTRLYENLAVWLAQESGPKGQYDFRVRLTEAVRIQPNWVQIETLWESLGGQMDDALRQLQGLIELLGDIPAGRVAGQDDLLRQADSLHRQLSLARQRLEEVLMRPPADQVVWLRARATHNEVALCAAPLYVNHLVERHLLWPKEAAIFTSATMRTGGDFSFIKERLGARDAEELAVGSPFDYESQVMLYLPTDVPEPNEPFHQKAINASLVALAQATGGRMLVLFTAHNQLRLTHDAIIRPLAGRGITVLAQGLGASRNQLLENFRTMPRAVLLGTRSFWEGIDVRGQALSCLVITRLPFAVPSDPIFAARSEGLDDPFMQYAVPDAILAFRQGFGRLIRTQTDRGVVVVMDRRLQTKNYGELFLRSLPPCTLVSGSLANLPAQAAAWIDQTWQQPASSSRSAQPRSAKSSEPEYVSLDQDGGYY